MRLEAIGAVGVEHGRCRGCHREPGDRARLTFLATARDTGGEVFDGRERVLGAGETIDVPAGTKHTFGNAGDDEMRVEFEFRPALDSTDRFYETYFGFAQEGRVNAKGMPGLLDIATVWASVSEHAVLAKPPAWVQNLLFRVLAPVARLSGREAPRCERTRAQS